MLALSATSLSFGSVTDSTTSPSMSVTLTNTGNAAMTISSIAVTGTNASAFTASNNCGTTLTASCIVTVTFSPTATQAYSAALTITDNASGSPQSVTLTGTGTAVPVPAASLSVAALTFTGVPIGTTSAAQTVTLTNTGTATLSLTSVALTGANASSFTIATNTCGASLAMQVYCTVTVTFSPAAVSSYTAALTFTDNAGGSPQSVSLSGTGVPVPTVTLSSGAFGTDLIGSVGLTSIQVQNSSAANSGSNVTFATPSLSGTNSSSFSLAGNSCAGVTLTPQSVCAIEVNFSPTAVQSYSATLNIPTNATTSPQSVALTGAGATEKNSCTTNSTTSPIKSAPTANFAGKALSGKVLAGSLPVIGASVQVFAAGQTGNGSTPTTLLTTTTDANGSFTMPAGFTCPYNNSVLYAIATGGKAGSSGAVNAGIELGSVLGLCNSITGSQTFTINEVTTAAMAWTMQQFMAAGGKMGATATNSSGTYNAAGIVLAANTFASLVNNLSGSAPGTYFPSTGTAPTAKINAAANLLNACIVSTGASSTACTQLYTLTTTSAGKPADTLDAMLNLVRNPGTNVSALYTQSIASTVYSPVLAAAPADWTLFVTFSGGGMNGPGSLALDSNGNVWVVNYFSVASLFSNTGAATFAGGITGNNLLNSYGGTVDINDVMWVANEESPYAINQALGSVSLLNSSGVAVGNYGSGGLDFPISIAIDTNGTSWIVDYGNSHTTLLSNAGTALSGTTGYSTDQYIFPVAIAVDSKCNGFIANQSSNTISFTSADGSTYGSYVVGSGPSGIATDASGNVWVANYYGNSVGAINSSGTLLSGSAGFTGGGINHPQGIAVDGAGTVWVASYRANAGANSVLSQLAGSGSTSALGTLLSPSAGWGGDAALLEPFAVAIDASGNLWVTNFGSNTLTEFIGMAAPVKTPLIGPVRVP